MLYRTLRQLILRGQTAELEEKIDLFYALGKLSAAEYNELIAMLSSTGDD